MDRVLNLINQNKHVLVIGDVMLDSYVYGTVTRQSPEANVPIVAEERTENKAGGAANVALSLSALGLTTSLIGLVGKDIEGERLNTLIEQSENIFQCVLIVDPKRPTTLKKRIIANGNHIARIDKEDCTEIDSNQSNEVLVALKTLHKTRSIDAVVLQDYNKGVFTKQSIKDLLEFLNDHKILHLVDPKHNHFFDYHGVSLFKPNKNELLHAFAQSHLDLKNLSDLASKLRSKTKAQLIMITLGDQGLYLDNGDKKAVFGGLSANDIDVCGAGDAVISAAVLGLMAELKFEAMGKLCNSIGFLSCLEVGVNPIDYQNMTKKCPSLYQDIKIKYV